MRRLGSIFGFPVYVQPTFLFLIAIFALPNTRNLQDLLSGLIIAGVVVVSILLHELGHALAYRAFGERNATIVLWGLGGLTYGRKPGRPWQDIVISLAGPFFGFALGMAAFWVRAVAGHVDPRIAAVLEWTVIVNIIWSIFNVLPVHPMDGGQALRTLLVAWKGLTGLRLSLVISIVTAVLAGLYVWRAGQYFVLILVALMLLRNVGELRGGRDSGMPHAP